MNPVYKKVLLYAAAVLFFAALSCTFVPQAVFKGEIVQSPDITGYVGASHEAKEWDEYHPEDKTAWTGSMFGGMPTILLTGNDTGDWVKPLFEAVRHAGRRPASYLFISLLGAFLLMLSLGIRPLLAMGGAVAVTFCSYNMQIIQSGHNTKMLALAYFPWVLAAVIFTYRKALAQKDAARKEWLPQTVLGAVLFGFALAFQVKADHVQITWYLALVIGIYALALLIRSLVDKERRKVLPGRWAAASLLLLLLGGAGIATSASKLVPLYEYTAQSIRGGSELSGNETKGVSADYASMWSYHWEELPNLMIPNLNGGSSESKITPSLKTYKALQRIGEDKMKPQDWNISVYWGPQPMTAGPMYMGAVTIFLFLLGLLLYKGKDKWWLLAATLVAIFLSLGAQFLPFTKFFYRFVPFYSKFRAVSMGLVVLQFTLPMLAFLLLEHLMREGCPRKDFLRKGGIALALTAGVCLLFALFPGLAGNFARPEDAGKTASLLEALTADRKALLVRDAWISFFLIVSTFLLLWWAVSGKTSARNKSAFGRKDAAMAAICLLILVNLFSVGKRYLNGQHFSSVKKFEKQFAMRPVDLEILKDDDPDFRVLDLTTDVFSDARLSYTHKSVGGYSPAKLQRYQDLIDRYLRAETSFLIKGLNERMDGQTLLTGIPIFNLLNTKYFIAKGNRPLYNPARLGNAWFVDGFRKAASPDEEIGLLAEVPLGSEAILGPDFGSVTAPAAPADSTDWIALTSYVPNEVKYHYKASSGRAAVFSEVFYPGWRASLEDGTPVDIFRADWTLRGAVVPAGEHDLTMRFDPPSYALGSRISRISSVLMYLLLLAAAAWIYITKRNEREGAGS